jgi:hypothetical protein
MRNVGSDTRSQGVDGFRVEATLANSVGNSDFREPLAPAGTRTHFVRTEARYHPPSSVGRVDSHAGPKL